MAIVAATKVAAMVAWRCEKHSCIVQTLVHCKSAPSLNYLTTLDRWSDAGLSFLLLYVK